MRKEKRIAGIGMVVALALLALWGCRAQVDDEVPAEQVGQEEGATVVDLLPRQTTLAAAYQIDGFGQLWRQSAIPQEALELIVPEAAILREVLYGEPLQGLDSSGTLYVAASSQGFEEVLAGLRLANPQIMAAINAEIPEAYHVRVLVPATDTQGLVASIEERCHQRQGSCQEILSMTAREPFVVIDMARDVAGGFWMPEGLEFEVEEGFAVENTAAWMAFISRQAPVAIYGSMEGIFDQLAMMDLGGVSYSLGLGDGADSEARRAEGLALIAQEFTYDSPEVAESEDVAVLLHNQGGTLFVDAVASLTEYGQGLVETLAESAPMRSRIRQDPALDMRWGLDLTGSIAAASKPLWADDVLGMEESTFARMLEGQTRESIWGFPLGVFRSPITGYALFDEFVGDQTTPAEFAMISGFWLQVFDVVDSEVTTAMGLHLPAQAPMDSFRQFASVALLPFGRHIDSQIVEMGESREFQASTALTVADLFGEEEVIIEPGVQIEMNLRRLARVLTEADGNDFVSSHQRMIFTALASLGAPELYVHAGFARGQGLVRLQWGGEALIAPEGVEGARAPRALEPTSQCLYTAREWSILGLSELAALDDDGQRRQTLVEEIGAALDELAQACEPEAAQKVSDLAADWQNLL